MWYVQVESILLWVGNGSQIFHLSKFTVRCYGRISIRRIMSWYAMDYLLQYTKSCLVKKHHVSLPKRKRLLNNLETGTWHQMEYASEFTLAPRLRTGCLILYQTLCFFRKSLIRHMLMVWLLLFIETRGVFGLHFLYQQKFVKFKISNKTRMRLVC